MEMYEGTTAAPENVKDCAMHCLSVLHWPPPLKMEAEELVDYIRKVFANLATLDSQVRKWCGEQDEVVIYMAQKMAELNVLI